MCQFPAGCCIGKGFRAHFLDTQSVSRMSKVGEKREVIFIPECSARPKKVAKLSSQDGAVKGNSEVIDVDSLLHFVPSERPVRHLRSKNTPSAKQVQCAPLSSPSVSKKVALARVWDSGKSVAGWLLSEKLDGMRAVWHNGALFSRSGNRIHTPSYFTAGLPEEFTLDGELWLGRGRFQDVISICRSKTPRQEWQDVMFLIFDAPDAPGNISQRLEAAKAALMRTSAAGVQDDGKQQFARVLKHEICRGPEHIMSELKRVEDLKGEGLMLRHPTNIFQAGRTRDLLKVKSFLDDEALVIGYEKGTGKHLNSMGALVCRSRTNQVFKVGSGFSNEERRAPPPLKSVITYRFFEKTRAGLPRFPVFDRIRPDVCPSTFA